MIEARTASSMSSGRTSTAGGGRRPMRWSAAKTSTMTPRRLSQGAADGRLAGGEGLEPLLQAPDAVLGAAHPLGGFDQGRIELGPVRLDGFDLGFEAPARLGIGGDRLFQDLEVLLPPRLLLGRFALRGKAPRAQASAAGLQRGPGKRQPSMRQGQ